MKYIVILADGMADYPVEELGGKTPMQSAKKPNIDKLFKKSKKGLVNNVPANLSPGSDVANLSAMGYDPQRFYTGRSPLEAVSIGIDLKPSDMVFRCNVVTLTDDENKYEDKIITDHSADEITTAEAKILIEDVQKEFGNEFLTFYPGVSYRHALVWDMGPDEFNLIPPHDILEKRIGDYLPKGKNGEILGRLMKKSYDFLNNHPINIERAKRGLNKANSIWIWGEGRKPQLASFKSLYGLNGSVISAVDLIKGIGICAGLDSIEVEGATGNIHTNFEGKAKAAVDAILNGSDYVFVHMEAPDECGHRHETENKVKSIELIDEKVVGYVTKKLEENNVDYRMLVLPDHPTPLALRTHTRDAVPFMIFDSTQVHENNNESFTEETAASSGLVIEEGYKLMEEFLK